MGMETEGMRKKVMRVGFFLEGKMVSWETQPPDLVKVMGSNHGPVVMCGDVEMVPWTDKLRLSLSSRNWIKA